MSRPTAWFLTICGLVGMAGAIAADEPVWFGIGLASVVFGARRLFFSKA